MKIIVISDTHNKHNNVELPEGDILVHCGDATNQKYEFEGFAKWFGSLNYKYKILVAGNHDQMIGRLGYKNTFHFLKNNGVIYLQDSSIEIDGIKFYGSPWVLEYDYRFGEFMCSEEKIKEYWEKIPLDTDVLITHGPAYLIGDLVQQDIWEPNVGSVSLKKRIEELNLKYHLFGHIHDDYGVFNADGYIACNAALINFYNQTMRKPIVIEI